MKKVGIGCLVLVGLLVVVVIGVGVFFGGDDQEPVTVAAAPMSATPKPQATMPKPVPTKKALPVASDRYREVANFRVVDGDTIELADGSGVRFLGIDAPEMSTKQGVQAKAVLEKHISGETLRLESDPSQATYDKYGRLLAHVWLRGENVDAWLVREGYAKNYVYEHKPTMYQDDYERAEMAAKSAERGIWAKPKPTKKAAPKPSVEPEPKEEYVYYKNCSEARKAGVTPLHEGDPGYRSGLDRDHDGTACE